jgi:cytochrome c-type biogenesis protein CcmH
MAASSTAEGPTQASGDQIADMADAFDEPHIMTVANTTAAHADATSGHTTGNAEISGTVEITSRLARQAKSGVTLFIYAKQPNAPGPPLAVLRVRAEHWPVTFTLNDGNAMVPGRNLSNANSVQIEARISKNGDAILLEV